MPSYIGSMEKLVSLDAQREKWITYLTGFILVCRLWKCMAIQVSLHLVEIFKLACLKAGFCRQYDDVEHKEPKPYWVERTRNRPGLVETSSGHLFEAQNPVRFKTRLPDEKVPVLPTLLLLKNILNLLDWSLLMRDRHPRLVALFGPNLLMSEDAFLERLDCSACPVPQIWGCSNCILEVDLHAWVSLD